MTPVPVSGVSSLAAEMAVPLELLVARGVDDAHAALAQLADDPIVADAPGEAVAHRRLVGERGPSRGRGLRRTRRLAPKPVGERAQGPAGPLVVGFLRHAALDVTPAPRPFDNPGRPRAGQPKVARR